MAAAPPAVPREARRRRGGGGEGDGDGEGEGDADGDEGTDGDSGGDEGGDGVGDAADDGNDPADAETAVPPDTITAIAAAAIGGGGRGRRGRRPGRRAMPPTAQAVAVGENEGEDTEPVVTALTTVDRDRRGSQRGAGASVAKAGGWRMGLVG